MKRFILTLALAFAALAMANSAQAAETAPSAYKSLQPFKQFAEGTGHGMARKYESRNKTEFIVLLRSPGKLRVDCERLVGQMAEIHKLPFENCEGAAAEIARNSDYDVVACRSGMFDRDNRLTVTNTNGSAFGFWQRECLVGETVLVYKNRPIASTMCANVAVPVMVPTIVPAPPPPPVTPVKLPPISGACPDVYTLKVNVWEQSAMNLPGVERTHAQEELQEKFVDAQHVSRTHGAQFRKAYAAGEIKRSAIAHSFRVSLIKTPESTGGAPTITSEEVVGDITVTGLRELRFLRAQLEQWDAIRVVSTEDSGILSPPRFHVSGFHEVRFFNHLPRTTLGEWDNNKVPDCIMSEHWAVRTREDK